MACTGVLENRHCWLLSPSYLHAFPLLREADCWECCGGNGVNHWFRWIPFDCFHYRLGSVLLDAWCFIKWMEVWVVPSLFHYWLLLASIVILHDTRLSVFQELSVLSPVLSAPDYIQVPQTLTMLCTSFLRILLVLNSDKLLMTATAIYIVFVVCWL